MLISTESTTYRRTKPIGLFLWTWSTGKTRFFKYFCHFSNTIILLKMTSQKMKSQAGRTDFSFSFHKCKLFSLTYFHNQKWAFQNIFSFLCPFFAPGKRMCYDSHSPCCRVRPWYNAKAQRVGIQWVPPTTDAAHTSMTSPFFWSFLAF